MHTDVQWETIDGRIVAKANNYIAVPDKATGGRRIVKADKVRSYERSFARQCHVYAGRMINRPFSLLCRVYYDRAAYDLDNSLKTLLDCLQYVGAIRDDNLCRRIEADKMIDGNRPRVEFALLPDAPPPSLFPDLERD